MQTILGSGGPIGTALARELRAHTSQVRLVSRNPEKVNPEDHLFPADLLDAAAVKRAVEGTEVAYLTAGLEYKYAVWKRDWPRIISNVIAACEEHECRLVFFDNMYLYDKDCLGHMTEKTPVSPPSKKGEVRARIAEVIMRNVWTGRITALIARSTDFYGPGIKNNSLLIETVFKPLSEGKKANWMTSADHKHSFTYTPDAAKATALLGNTEDAFNQVWHLPTAANPLTGHEWVNAVASEMGIKPAYRSVPKFVVQMMGLFNSAMKETAEMMYQFDRDYVFDSTKFEEKYHIHPTLYEDGIKEVVAADFSGKKSDNRKRNY